MSDEGVPVNSVRDLEYLLDDPLAKARAITYTLIEQIIRANKNGVGTGGYGDVHLGVLGNKKKVAVKELVYKQENTDVVLIKEISCLEKARRHDNIVRLVGYTADKTVKVSEGTLGPRMSETRKRYLCLEYAPCGDLHDYIQRMSVQPNGGDPQANTKGYDEAKWTTYYQIIMGICNGLEHIHKQQIIHLDLKPKNILLDAYSRPKITDFGVSVCLTEEEPTGTPGTTGFQAPEMLTENKITYKSDIYALGATIARLLMRSNSGNVEKWLEENLEAKNCPEEMRSFINIAQNCMKPNPNERNTLEQTIKQLKEMCLEDLKIDDSEEVLKVVPHNLPYRPFGPENPVSSELNVVNRTGQFVAYTIIRKGIRKKNNAASILMPWGTCSHVIPMDTSETFLVQSTVIAKNIDIANIPVDMFEMKAPGRRIYEVEVNVVVAKAQPSEGLQLKAEITDTLPPVIPGSNNGSLDVQPTELCFDRKTMTCSVHLTNNNSENKVAYRIQDKSKCDPDIITISYGIVLPMSACTIVLIKARRPHYLDERRSVINRKSGDVILQSIVCDFGTVSLKDIKDCDNFFEKFTKNVHKVPLKVLYSRKGETTSQLLSPPVPCIKITTVTNTSSITGHAVKYVEANPTMPWVVAIRILSLTVEVWNYETQRQSVADTFDVMEVKNVENKITAIFSPTFIPRESWLILSDFQGGTHVYSYKSEMKRIKIFRLDFGPASRAVHPTKPYMLSSCDATEKIYLLDWTNGWKIKMTFIKEYCVLARQLVFNPDPKDGAGDNFATAMEDWTVQLWYIDYPRCYHTLFGHYAKVNCLAFFKCDGKQYLITGSDDLTAKIWDLEERTCIHTLKDFTSPVVRVFAHPNLPVLITGTENGIVHVWSSSSMRLQRTFDISYGGEILSFALACPVGSTRVVIGQAEAISIMDFSDEANINREGQKELETLKCGEPEPKAGEHLRPPLATGSEGPTSVPAINEIDQLLSKIDKLAQKVPTTGDRLSRISRIFPHGHGPREETVKEATDYDVGVLECLKLATGYIRDSFVMLGKKQDAICSEFEKEDAYAETSGDATSAKYKEEDEDTESLSSNNNDTDFDEDDETSEEGTGEDNIDSATEVATLCDQDSESLSSNNVNASHDDIEACEEVEGADIGNINSARGGLSG